jgi:hypothetical protein
MPPVGFELKISAGEWPQTYAYTARPLGPAWILKYGILNHTSLTLKSTGQSSPHHQVLTPGVTVAPVLTVTVHTTNEALKRLQRQRWFRGLVKAPK